MKPERDAKPKGTPAATERRWEPMRLMYVGDIAEVMKGKPGSMGDGGSPKKS